MSRYLWIFIPVLLIILTACDNKAIVTFYNKNITKTPITCMRLAIPPGQNELKNTLQKLYPFQNDCNLTLEVSTKCGIHCNSMQNAAAQATGNFPTSYLKMELRKGWTLQYSYYIDLKEKPGKDDIEEGFSRIEKDLQIIRKQ